MHIGGAFTDIGGVHVPASPPCPCRIRFSPTALVTDLSDAASPNEQDSPDSTSEKPSLGNVAFGSTTEAHAF